MIFNEELAGGRARVTTEEALKANIKQVFALRNVAECEVYDKRTHTAGSRSFVFGDQNV